MFFVLLLIIAEEIHIYCLFQTESYVLLLPLLLIFSSISSQISVSIPPLPPHCKNILIFIETQSTCVSSSGGSHFEVIWRTNYFVIELTSTLVHASQIKNFKISAALGCELYFQ